ncbi:tetratricopeptide repeat protein 28-like, partial [Ctenocephalides felis]|uniref:tetratricopeptide repeat protein 28-like n=1 Tax=Ctenocephalides felis TaxID=7515 RepID=UPI000E6E355D
SSSRRTFSGDGSLEIHEVEMNPNISLGGLNDGLLNTKDISQLQLNTKLVVINATIFDETDANYDIVMKTNTNALYELSSAFLNSGVHCVLVSLWPASDVGAVKILLKTFYSSLMQGSRVARALSEAMQTVQYTKQFSHPANWAGFTLMGSNIRLCTKAAQMNESLQDILLHHNPEHSRRQCLRVCLHLVEKSLQRIHEGRRNAMYTTLRSIENKTTSSGSKNGDKEETEDLTKYNNAGWKNLLISVGFRFEPAANGVPSSVFFPQSDPCARLAKCSGILQALLGLSHASLQAVQSLINDETRSKKSAKLNYNNTQQEEISQEIISAVKKCSEQLVEKQPGDGIEISLSVRSWRITGCHELFASLGFDLVSVGSDRIKLRAGKKLIQGRHTIADEPKSLSSSKSSSMESLNSDNSICPYISNQKNVNPQTLNDVHQQLDKSISKLSSGRGAFISYVRGRGEPDGGSTINSHAPSTTYTQSQLNSNVHIHPLNSNSHINLLINSDNNLHTNSRIATANIKSVETKGLWNARNHYMGLSRTAVKVSNLWVTYQ